MASQHFHYFLLDEHQSYLQFSFHCLDPSRGRGGACGRSAPVGYKGDLLLRILLYIDLLRAIFILCRSNAEKEMADLGHHQAGLLR